MKDFVSEHWITVVGVVTALLLGWAVFASPGGSWPRMVSIAALATLLVTSTAILLRARLRVPAASLSQVIQDVEAEPAARPSADWKGKAIL